MNNVILNWNLKKSVLKENGIGTLAGITAGGIGGATLGVAETKYINEAINKVTMCDTPQEALQTIKDIIYVVEKENGKQPKNFSRRNVLLHKLPEIKKILTSMLNRINGSWKKKCIGYLKSLRNFSIARNAVVGGLTGGLAGSTLS